MPSAEEARWRRSSACSPFNDCVEVLMYHRVVAVRDTKAPVNALRFDRDHWAGFVDHLSREP